MIKNWPDNAKELFEIVKIVVDRFNSGDEPKDLIYKLQKWMSDYKKELKK